MLMQSAFMVEAPQRDLTTLLSRLQNTDVRHADFLRRRLRELRVPAGHFPNGGLSAAPDEALGILIDEASHARASVEMLAATLFLKRALCEAYADYLAVTNPIADSPGIESCRQFWRRKAKPSRCCNSRSTIWFEAKMTKPKPKTSLPGLSSTRCPLAE